MRTSFRPTEILQSVAVQTSIDVTEYVHGYVGVGPSTVCLGSVNGRIFHVVWLEIRGSADTCYIRGSANCVHPHRALRIRGCADKCSAT